MNRVKSDLFKIGILRTCCFKFARLDSCLKRQLYNKDYCTSIRDCERTSEFKSRHQNSRQVVAIKDVFVVVLFLIVFDCFLLIPPSPLL